MGFQHRHQDLLCEAAMRCALPNVQAAELSREEAIAALKRSSGDEDSALLSELGCFRLNQKLLQELGWEYALARCKAYMQAPTVSKSITDSSDQAVV